MKSIIYARVSTEEQVEKGSSIREQVEKCGKYAEFLGLEAEVITDEGRSGRDWSREGAAKLLKLVENGELEHLIVHRIDRLSRNSSELDAIERKLRENGVKFHSVTESINTETPVGRFVFRIFAAKAEFEADIIRENTRNGLKRKKENGQWVGRVPFGYRMVDKGLVEDPEQQNTVDLAVAMRRDGDNWVSIARKLALDKMTIMRAVKRRENEDTSINRPS